MDWQILGHQKQTEFLTKAIQSGRIAHAYIFAGPAGVGKKTVAQKFAEFLIGTIKNNPDCIEIVGREGIRIEAIRDLAYKLSLKPYSASYKVAVIDDAENMTTEASNALLKVFEEPKPGTVIILITSNPQKLLSTITSRAQKVTFGLVLEEEYKTFLEQAPDQKRLLAQKLSLGRPGIAYKILNASEDQIAELERTLALFEILTRGDLVDKMKMVYEIADLETAQIKEILESWIVLSKNHGHKRHLLAASGLMDRNVNSKLLLSNLILNFSV
ncbi:MAG: AAA family ATPase [Candidatus Doudnabacteria bacterium]|nr:AAA family ATPase [Candidatus Doudnabacteria bacterium]